MFQARFRAGPGPGAAADRQAAASPECRSAAPGGL